MENIRKNELKKEFPYLKFYDEEGYFIYDEFPQKDFYTVLKENIEKKNLENVEAINIKGYFITFGELLKKCDTYSKSLIAMDIERGDVIPLSAFLTVESIIMLISLMRIGACVKVVDPMGSIELEKQLESDSSYKCLICNDFSFLMTKEIMNKNKIGKFVIMPLFNSIPLALDLDNPILMAMRLKKVKLRGENIVNFETFLAQGEKIQSIPEYKYVEKELSQIFFTSGSTGGPKAVALPVESAVGMVYAHLYGGYGFEPGEKMFSMAPLHLAFGAIQSILMPLGLGITICIEPIPNNNYMKKYVTKDIQYILQGPKQWKVIQDYFQPGIEAIYNQEGELIGYARNSKISPQNIKNAVLRYFRKVKKINLKYAISGSEKMTIATQDVLNETFEQHASFAKAYEGYGSTENGVAVSSNKNEAYKKGTVGIPLLGVRFKVIDPLTLKVLGPGEEGMAVTNSMMNMLGYYPLDKNQDINEECFVEIMDEDRIKRKYLKSYDKVKMDEEGFIEIIGRYKRIISLPSGKKISPHPIEDTICKHPIVEECVVVGRKTANPDETQPVAYIVIKNEYKELQKNPLILKQKLKEFCIGKMDLENIPIDFIAIDIIPNIKRSGKADWLKIQELDDSNNLT